ncbi:Stk1 family PASTA domain-containing Ser/Thr kinase [Corynebacterium aquatimens]|uniref:non-specific serine/threonine protein kinase n=1 Tax=Corynebacterium aquatimens TaxID=1190508 RepID=A0A931E2L9_9CORY|nr:Stk1 family PASTA domain-containing Ser/Thr kinase [Corynebacterium aquatimens]MBG6122646.1 serine/threonine-protein kinase [Corynebacterium aquatimens]WJY64816.1 Serine/threonine-protein kinase PknB [Corynebacterium aquatimens]
MTLVGDRYQLGDMIGTGGMSDVYVATDTLLGREVAVKMLKVDMARDENFRERFRKEAQNSARLNHPNIVAVYDTGATEVDGISVPYIVMEHIKGRNLRDIVREDGPLRPEEAAALMIPVTAALQASHDAGIIHRDVKPANIMVTNTGEVKVMDFGIARALDDSTAAMTQTSAVIGTAQYLSPEQARGKNADARSDIYALGCVMYEAVTGTPPFSGETPFAVAYQHVQEDAEPPSSHMGELNLTDTQAVNVDAVILTAMAKHPADRYQSADEMSEDLQRLERGAVTKAARNHVTESEPTTQVVTPAATVEGSSTRVVSAAEQPEESDQDDYDEYYDENGYYDEDGNYYEYSDEYDDEFGAYDPEYDEYEEAPLASGESRYSQHRLAQNRKNGSIWKWLLAVLAALAIVGGSLYAINEFGGKEEEVENNVVTVPNVIGKPREEAIRSIEALGLQVNISEKPSPDVPRGEVMAVNPNAGSQLKPGAQVTLTVSSGREITDVPDITGKTPQEAKDLLKKAGLTLNDDIERDSSDNVEEGKIISQTPVAGSQLSKGSKVSIKVSTGKEKIRIPSLSGMKVDQARATLSSLGLEATVTEIDSENPKGEVLAVADEGKEVTEGTKVNLQVSNGILMKMPNLVKMTKSRAEETLRSQGWSGRLREGERFSTLVPDDHERISGSRPGAGETIRKDQDITVDVWELGVRDLLP